MDLSRYASLGDNAHISLRTFRANGDTVDTAVWFCQIEDDYYIRTVSNSAKVRRLRANAFAAVAPCHWDGELTGPWQQVQATVMDDGDPLIPELDSRMNAFYGDYRRELTQLMSQLGKALCYIRLTPLRDNGNRDTGVDDSLDSR